MDQWQQKVQLLLEEQASMVAEIDRLREFETSVREAWHKPDPFVTLAADVASAITRLDERKKLLDQG